MRNGKVRGGGTENRDLSRAGISEKFESDSIRDRKPVKVSRAGDAVRMTGGETAFWGRNGVC